MKRRSILFLILTFLCALTLGVFTSCGGDENSLSVKDWGNEKVTCKLGDCYEIPQYEAKGNGGETYEVSVLVVKKDGNVAIPLIDGAFDVTSKKGYEVQYTATDGEKSAKKVLSVKVVDETAPNISCFSSTIATVGVRYEWTDITVMDSGVEIEKYDVEVYNAATNQKVSSDSTGFTPTDTGDYHLKITASDGDGNQGELTYTVFARPNATGGEVETADDAGVKYAVYTFGVSATRKIYSEYSTFTRLGKGGSAVISSELGAETGVFITPRKDVGYTDTGYFSAWTYILDSVCEERTVKTSLSEFSVPTNQWVEIKLDQAAVGGYKTFWDKFKAGGTALFSVVNNATDYAIFLDDVYFVESANALDGVQETYQEGETLTFTASQGAVVELSAFGKTEQIQSGVTLTKAGTYTVTAYDAARAKAAVSKTFTVGENSVFFDDAESWFTAGENKAPSVVDGEGNLVKATYYLVNAKTGEKVQLTGNRKFTLSEEKVIFLLAEGTYQGKPFTLYKGYDVRRAGKGVLYSFDDSSYVISQSGWHEEFAGEKGVLELYISSGGNSSTKGWRTSFSKEYYQQFKYLRFKIYATHTFGIALLSLSKWDTLSLVNESSANKLYQWNYYYVDIKKYMDNYDSINGNSDLGVWMDAKGGKIYLAEIAAVQAIGATDGFVETEDGVGGPWDEQWQ